VWTRGLVRWAHADLLRRRAVEAGLETIRFS